jgi:hypothetical protein
MVPTGYQVPNGTGGQKPRNCGTKWYPVPLGTGTWYHSAGSREELRMTKDYDLDEDGRRSYELAIKILGQRMRDGECLRLDGRCVFCGWEECRLENCKQDFASRVVTGDGSGGK